MATAYTILLPRPAGVPAPITVRIVAMRDDAKKLTREELEALAAAYPPPDEASRAALERDLARAPSQRTKSTTKARAKSPPAKATPKRKAAKKPTRARSK